jgi:hypothetical protein
VRNATRMLATNAYNKYCHVIALTTHFIRCAMRNLLLVLALVPAMSQAALVMEDGPQKDAAPALANKPTAVIVPAKPPAIVAAPQITLAPTIAKAPLTPAPSLASLNVATVSVPTSPDWNTTAAPIAPAGEQFALRAGESIQTQIQRWAKRAGWTLTWNSPDDWINPGDRAFGTNFETATQKVFEQLNKNGADVRADIWVGNHSVVVDQAGVSQ